MHYTAQNPLLQFLGNIKKFCKKVSVGQSCPRAAVTHYQAVYSVVLAHLRCYTAWGDMSATYEKQRTFSILAVTYLLMRGKNSTL